MKYIIPILILLMASPVFAIDYNGYIIQDGNKLYCERYSTFFSGYNILYFEPVGPEGMGMVTIRAFGEDEQFYPIGNNCELLTDEIRKLRQEIEELEKIKDWYENSIHN